MKRLGCFFMSFILFFSVMSVPASANSNMNNQFYYNSNSISYNDKLFLNKVAPIFNHISLNNNYLILNLDEKVLINEYNFTDNDVIRLKNIIKSYNISINNNTLDKIHKQRLHLSDWKVYFNNMDVHTYLLIAAQIGPAAIILALNIMGTLYPGVGNVISTAVGIFGAGTIIYNVFQAVALNKGIYIGIKWVGPFPNPDIGIW